MSEKKSQSKINKLTEKNNQKKNQRTNNKFIIITSVFCIIFLTFFASFLFTFLDRSFYDNSYAKYGTYDNIGVEGVRQTTDSLVTYMLSENSNPESANLYVFTPNEQSHLKDVHWVIRISKYVSILCLITLISIFAFRYYKNQELAMFSKRIAKYSAYWGIGILLIFAILGSNFNWFFEVFHKILFPQGNYTFPTTSILIIMFPENFFKDFAIRILIGSGLFFIIIYCLGLIPKHKEHNRKTKK